MTDLQAVRAAQAEAATRREALRAELDAAGTDRGARRQVKDALAALHSEYASRFDQLFADLEIDAEGGVPLLLLPVRLEVRSTADGSSLKVRLFPDAIHTESLDEGLTPAELAAGSAYWSQVWTTGDSAGPWPDLQAAVGARRAAWVADALTPINLGERPNGDPRLPDVPVSPVNVGGPAVVRTLPDRFLVRIEQPGADPVTVSTRPIPDELPVGLTDVDRLDALAVDDTDLPPLDDTLRWLVDYDEAVRLGLAVTVPLPIPGADVTRVTAYGVRAALAPQEGAARLERLLRSHRFTDGVEFLPQGTPTNNTDGVRAEWSRRTVAGPPDLAGGAASPGENAQVTARALGLDAARLAPLSHAADAEQSRAAAFHTALWDTTWGDAIEYLTPKGRANGDKRLDSPTLDAVREHWEGHVRGRGPIPALRVGRQPYGVLPVLDSGPAYGPVVGDSVERRLVPFIRNQRWPWEDATAAVRTVMNGPLDEVLPDILGTDAVLRGLRVRTALTPDPVVWETMAALVGDTGSRDAQGQISYVVTLLSGVGNDALDGNLLTGRKTRTLALPLVHESDGTFIDNLLQDVPRPAAAASVLQVLLAHADAVSRHSIESMATPEMLDGTLRAAVFESRTDVDREFVATALQSVQRGDLRDPVIDDAARHVAERVGPYDARVLADRHPLPSLAPPTAVQRLAGTQPQFEILRGAAGMRLIGGLFRAARQRRRFQEALATILSVADVGERRLLLAETLDCCSHRLDAWITSVASRRLADLRAASPTGVVLGAYGMIENLRLVTPEPAGEIDGRAVLHDPGDGGYIHAPGLTHAATAAVLRSGRLTHRRGDPSTEALDIDLCSTRMREALSLLDGIRTGQSLGALLGYRLERRLHDRSGDGLELDRFIYVLRTLAPSRAGRLTDPGNPPEESVAASDVVDGLRLLQIAPATISAKLVSGPDDTRYIDAWVPPQPGEADAVLAAVAELDSTHDAIADLLLAESVHQLVSGNPSRAAAVLDLLGAGEAGPPEPEITRVPRGGVPHQHRLAILVADPPPAPAPGWATNTARALAEPRLEAWAQGALGDPAGVTLVEEDARTLADAGLSALDVLYDSDGDSVATSSLVTRLRALLPDLPPGLGQGPGPLARTWELAGLLRGLVLRARPLDVADVGRPVEESAQGRSVDAAEILARAGAAVSGLDAALALADPSLGAAADLAGVAAYGLRPPPRTSLSLTPEEEVIGVQALLDAGAGRVEQARLLLAKAADPASSGLPTVVAALAAEALAVVFGGAAGGFLALPVITGPPPGERDLWAGGCGPGGVTARPGAAIRPWLQRAGALREAAAEYGECLLAREAAGSMAALRVVQTPGSAYGTWVGMPFPDAAPPQVPLSSMVAEVAVGAGQVDALAADLTGRLAGVVIDEWTEVVPRRLLRGNPSAPDDPPTLVDVTTTGVALHANGPGARPPQALLLAMTPDGGSWTADRLVAVLEETFTLARMRGVTLQDIPFAGRYLPALYFRDWSLQGEPTLSFSKLTTTFETAHSLAYLKVVDP